MSRVLLSLTVAICALTGGTSSMGGQQATEATLYDARALRVETSWGRHLLVRGRDGALVGRIGSRGFDFPEAVALSPNAVREAKEFKANYGRGNTVLALGILAWGIGGGVTRMDDVDPLVTISAWTAVASGTAMMLYGGVKLNKAFTALSRSIWWYNRDLSR